MKIKKRMNRFHFFSLFSIITLAFIIMFGFSTDYTTAAEGEKKVTIIHTNDIHAQIDDFGKLAAYKQKEEATSDIFFYVDAGDIFSGNPVVDLNEGEPIIDLLNQVGLDLIGIGNHEFDYGVEALNKRMDEANFEFISANTEVVDSEFNQPEPYIIVEEDGVKFGFITLTQAPPATAPKNIVGIEFHDYKETIKHYEHLRDEVDVLIGVNHIGLSEDRKVAEAFDMFDAIIGGHSHTEMKKEEVVNDTVIVQTGSHLNNIGNMTITLDAKNKVRSIDWALQSVEALTDVDSEVQTIIDAYNAEMEEELKEVIGKTTGLGQGGKYEGDVPLGNFWTDAMRRLVDSDIAFTNNGGIRTDIPAGDLTVGHILNVEPFSNQVMEINMTGEAIRNVLEYSFTRDNRNQIDLQTSGLEYVIHLDVFGDFKEVEITINGKPIEDTKVYKAAVPDYIGSGGSGYDFVGEVVTSNAGLMTAAMIDHAKALMEDNETIEVTAGNRIQIEREAINSLTVTEAIANNEGRAIVTGYVVGQLDLADGNEAIFLADTKDEQEPTKMLAVEITAENKDAYGIESGSELTGKVLSATGELGPVNDQAGMTAVEGIKLLNVLSIEDAKKLGNDKNVTVEGVVMSDSGAWGSEGFYVHDTTGGIYVYQGDYELEEGDFVRVTGQKGEHEGEGQISAVSSIEVLDKNHSLPDVKTIKINELNESFVGELVKIEQVTINDIEEFDYGTFQFVDQADEEEEPIIFRIDNRTGLTYSDFKYSNDDRVDVIGIVGKFGDTLQVKPRKEADIVEFKESEKEPTHPVKPEQPEKPEGEDSAQEDEKDTNETEENNGGRVDEKTPPATGNIDSQKGGSALPKTATNTWNMLAIGGALLILGGGLLFIIQRKRKANNS